MYHLQFSLQGNSPETFGYTFVQVTSVLVPRIFWIFCVMTKFTANASQCGSWFLYLQDASEIHEANTYSNYKIQR